MAVLSFIETLAIPAGTTLLDPSRQELNVVPGRVVLLRLYVPPGPRGEVSLWFLHQFSQLAPAPPKTWDNLDDDIIEYPLHYDVRPGETQFHLCGASPYATFEHSIDFELLVDTATQPGTTTPQLGLTDRLLSALGLGG
jgi:hypothetical protein